jgi:hypothetical protein
LKNKINIIQHPNAEPENVLKKWYWFWAWPKFFLMEQNPNSSP